MKKELFLLPLLPFLLSSCLGDDDDQYSAWKKQNDDYIAEFELNTSTGKNGYEKIVPEWAPQNSVFIKWHNDRTLTASNLKPLSNSTVDITYQLEDIDGNQLGNSFASTTYGDSIFRSKPNHNIVGMWAAMLEMHVGDSVTLVIPYPSAYGAQSMGSVKPYSTLIYQVKMKGIPAFEKE